MASREPEAWVTVRQCATVTGYTLDQVKHAVRTKRIKQRRRPIAEGEDRRSEIEVLPSSMKPPAPTGRPRKKSAKASRVRK